MSAYWRVVGISMVMHLKQQVVNSFVLFSIFVQPFLVVLLGMYILRDEAATRAIYVIVGSGLCTLWSGTLFFNVENVMSERWSGTLEYLVASPTPLPLVIFGKTLTNTFLSLTSMVIAYVVVSIGFGVTITITNPAAFAVSVVLTVVAMLTLGFALAPYMALNFSAEAWVNALEFPMYILGAFLIPLSILPTWLQPISMLLSPYWAARALHASSSEGAGLAQISISWLAILSLALIYILLARWIFRRIIRKATVEATLGLW